MRFLGGKRREWRGVSKYYVRGDVVGLMLAVLVAGRTLEARGSNIFCTDCKLPIGPLERDSNLRLCLERNG